jgi:mannosyl-3-phosphoglycerate synthase
MVRISWMSKPKIQDGRLFFNRWGRTSQVTNEYLNLLLAEYSGFGTNIIATGNAGEHALSVDLGMKMCVASGFAVEPHQYIELFEQFGGVMPTPNPAILKRGVDIYQIETRNPHFHEDKGADHVQEMRLQALNVLYHSPICLDSVRKEIERFLRKQDVITDDEKPPRELVYRALDEMDLDAFLEALLAEEETFTQIRQRRLAGIIEDEPIGHSVATGTRQESV